VVGTVGGVGSGVGICGVSSVGGSSGLDSSVPVVSRGDIGELC